MFSLQNCLVEGEIIVCNFNAFPESFSNHSAGHTLCYTAPRPPTFSYQIPPRVGRYGYPTGGNDEQSEHGGIKRELSWTWRTSGAGQTEALEESVWELCPGYDSSTRASCTCAPWDQTLEKPPKPSEQRVEESNGHVYESAGEGRHNVCGILRDPRKNRPNNDNIGEEKHGGYLASRKRRCRESVSGFLVSSEVAVMAGITDPLLGGSVRVA